MLPAAAGAGRVAISAATLKAVKSVLIKGCPLGNVQ